MSRLNKALLVTAAALLAAVLVILLRPGTGAAQSASADTSLAHGPGGMWIVRGNRVYICDLDPVRPATVEPPTPRCGTPLTLR